MSSPSSSSVRGSTASTPGALPSATAPIQIAMSWAVERMEPAGASAPSVHGPVGTPESVWPAGAPAGRSA